MCGLGAFIGKGNTNRLIALGSMLEDRGSDSVGLAYVKENQIQIAKIAERPCLALNMSLRLAVTEMAISGMGILHTRQATQGSITSENAHPFLTDGIAFAHNGIILNDDDFGKYAVDSQSLIHGIKAKDFSKYEGPIALIWIQDGKLHAYRSGNPLYRGKHRGTTYLASEAEQLKAIGCTSVKEVKEGFIYTFHTPENMTTEKVKKNKSYTFSYQGKTWEDYSLDGYKKPEYDYKLDSPSFPKHKEWVNASDYSKEKQDVREDFRTLEDIDRDRIVTDWCDMCGSKGELTEGYCLECLLWLENEGISMKDIPPSDLPPVTSLEVR